jgi:steroid 5-alpha reductase family enzyme
MYPLLELGFDFLILLGEACVFFAVCWLVAKKIDNWSIVDVAWSYGFALVGLQILAVHFWIFPLGGQGVLMAIATVLWSLRLGTHLAGRVLGHLDQEDGRYLKMRAEHGERMPAQMAYFYFIQALVLAILCLPLLSSNPTGASGPAQTIHWVGLGVVGLALLIETIADAQLAAFKKDPANKGQVCERGLWAWSRHPNYFFQSLLWWGLFLMALPAPWGWTAIIAPAAMLHFLLNVTGIPLTEKLSVEKRGEVYRKYQRTTNAFVPWFRRKL